MWGLWEQIPRWDETRMGLIGTNTSEGWRRTRPEEPAGTGSRPRCRCDICERRKGRRDWVGRASDHCAHQERLRQTDGRGVPGSKRENPSSRWMAQLNSPMLLSLRRWGSPPMLWGTQSSCGGVCPLLKGDLSESPQNPSRLAPEPMLLLILLRYLLVLWGCAVKEVTLSRWKASGGKGTLGYTGRGPSSHRVAVQSAASGGEELNSNLPVQTHSKFALEQSPSSHKISWKFSANID